MENCLLVCVSVWFGLEKRVKSSRGFETFFFSRFGSPVSRLERKLADGMVLGCTCTEPCWGISMKVSLSESPMICVGSLVICCSGVLFVIHDPYEKTGGHSMRW